MSGQNVTVDLHHITRVEGHGNIIVNVTNGNIEKCEWQVPEAPRFFEAMVVGRHYSEVARITSRICGICAVGHTLASVKATEDALGIEVSWQTDRLRRICTQPAGRIGIEKKPAIGVCMAGGGGGGAPECCTSLTKVLRTCGFDIVDMIPVRRQNLAAKLPQLEMTGQWLADKPTSD